MNIKSKKFSIVLLTLIFTVSVFAVTAFAEVDPGAPITPGDQITEPASSEAAPPSNIVTETSSTVPETNSDVTETSSSPADEGNSSIPEKKASSDSASRKETTSSKHQSQVPTRAIDTQTHRVEATASQAAQAVSDPDILSSENWSELLSSGDSTQSQNAAAGAAAISSTASAAEVGGVSWILLLGVVLIVLALCGFGLFAYLQFFSNRGGRNGRGGQRSLESSSADAPAEENNEEPLTFTDISSDSDGTQHREDYVPNGSRSSADILSTSTAAVPANPGVKPQSATILPATSVKSAALKPKVAKKAPVTDMDVTAPIPKAILPDRKPVVPTQGVQPASKSQATPISSNSNFDWEKFFNDQK